MEKLPVHVPKPEVPRRGASRFALVALLTFGAVAAQLLVSSSSTTSYDALRNQFGSCSHKSSSPPTIHQKVKWSPCESNQTFSCGYIKVPKDHFNTSVGMAEIAVLKVPATAPKHLRLGGIMINPGGPGGSGVGFALRMGDSLRNLTDGRYDIIGFDPRGIGKTKPLVQCFDSTLDYDLFKSGTVLERSFDISPDPFSATGQLRLLEQNRELLALQEVAFTRCHDRMGDELLYMSTSTVIRDIDFMSQVLYGKDEPINFLGASYGTLMGTFLVNLLGKERIGRVIIDGMMSAPEYVTERPETWLNWDMGYTDQAFSWFLRDCAEVGPERCALAKKVGDDPNDIAQRLDDFLDDLYTKPMPVPYGTRPGILNSGGARAILYQVTNRPASWPAYATMFAEALAGNGTLLYNALSLPLPFSSRHSNFTEDMSRVAVTCTDIRPYKDESEWPTAEDLVDATLKVLNTTSRRFGAASNVLEPDGGCQFWNAAGKTKERFVGPFNATLNTPILIVSNVADPITPLSSGRELNRLMGNSSRILVQNSPGHCSFGSVSACKTLIWKQYLVDGIIPEDESFCQVDRGYFPVPKGTAAEEQGGVEAKAAGLAVAEMMAQAWGEWEREMM